MQPRGSRGGERSQRQAFYIHQDFAIVEANCRFGFALQRQDYRALDAAGNDRYIAGITQVYNSYAATWTLLCRELPALAAVVPVGKGGNKGKGAKGARAAPLAGRL